MFIRSNRTMIIYLLLFLVVQGCRESLPNPESILKGKELFDYYGCKTCHSVAGDAMYGPALNDLIGNEILVIQEGQPKRITADRKYLLRSIADPEFEKLSGFEDRTMPATKMPGEHANAIADYIISLNSSYQSE